MYDDNYRVDVGEQGRVETRMRDISEDDAVDYVAGVIAEKHQAGYWILETRPSFILMMNRDYKPFAIRVRRYAEVKAS